MQSIKPMKIRFYAVISSNTRFFQHTIKIIQLKLPILRHTFGGQIDPQNMISSVTLWNMETTNFLLWLSLKITPCQYCKSDIIIWWRLFLTSSRHFGDVIASNWIWRSSVKLTPLVVAGMNSLTRKTLETNMRWSKSPYKRKFTLGVDLTPKGIGRSFFI